MLHAKFSKERRVCIKTLKSMLEAIKNQNVDYNWKFWQAFKNFQA